VDADKEQISEVLVRYATGIDSKDWPVLRSCWADEIDVDYSSWAASPAPTRSPPR
jgi:3-phenylpropionate/cinnamic acid dioxygenase small subunit